MFRWLYQDRQGHESSDVLKVYNTNASAWIAIFIMLLRAGFTCRVLMGSGVSQLQTLYLK